MGILICILIVISLGRKEVNVSVLLDHAFFLLSFNVFYVLHMFILFLPRFVFYDKSSVTLSGIRSRLQFIALSFKQ